MNAQTDSHRLPIRILHRDDLPLGGFAGLKEHQLVTDRRVFGHHRRPDAWDGLGGFVYLADARFVPHGQTHLHPHRKIDVISVMAAGRIAHEGSLGAGTEVAAPNVQVQRSGAEGFTHNEINPDDTPNRMIQMWVVPDELAPSADYQIHEPKPGAVTRIYGGDEPHGETFPGSTEVHIAYLDAGQQATFAGPTMAYVIGGAGKANGFAVADGDMLRGEGLNLEAREALRAIVVTQLA
ncbi:MAG: pirin family protein [Planctomycetota bacterium]|jgi:redox-sensitive bicupin YhaK (pirin superfamily)